MNTASAYTPLESLFLFQFLLKFGIEPSTFSRISELLNRNALIRQEKTYDAARLSPDALRELFLHLLREELQDEAARSESPGPGPGVSRKRKVQSPALPTLKEAREHVEKLPILVDRLYAKYRDFTVRQIREDEEHIDRLAKEIEVLGRDERGSETRELEGDAAASGQNGSLDVEAQEEPKLTNGSRGLSPSPQETVKSPKTSPVPARPPSPEPQKEVTAAPPAESEATKATPEPTSLQGAGGPNGLQSQDAGAQPSLPVQTEPAKVQQPSSAPLAAPTAVAPTPDTLPGRQPSPRLQQLQRQEGPQIQWQPAYTPSTPPPGDSRGGRSSPLPPQPSQDAALQHPHGGPVQGTGPMGASQSRPLQPPVVHAPQGATPASPHSGPVQMQPPPQSPMQRPVAPPLPQSQAPGTPGYVSQSGRAADAQESAGEGQQQALLGPAGVPSSHGPIQATPTVVPAPVSQPGVSSQQGHAQAVPPSPFDRVSSQTRSTLARIGALLRTPAAQRYGAQAPFTPIQSQLPSRVDGIERGSSTKWASHATPSTRPEQGPVPPPDLEELSPPLRPTRLPDPVPSSTPLAGASASAPTNAQEQAEQRKPSGKQIQRIDTDAGRSRGGRWLRPGKGATTPVGTHATRRSQSVMSQPDEADPTVRKVKVEDAATPRPTDETGDTTADESLPGGRNLATPSSVTSRLQNKRKRETTPPEEEPRAPPPGPHTHVLWTRSFQRVSASALDQIGGHRHANMFAAPLKEANAPGYRTVVLQPQDLKSIRTAITAGNKAAMAAAQALPGGDPGTSSVWLPISEELVPPKGIINSAQLDRELLHMFANAIMYNPDPNRGPGPAFKRRGPGRQRSVAADGADEHGGEELVGYEVDENGVVKATQNMYLETRKIMLDLRSAEKGRFGDVGPPPPPDGSVLVSRTIAAAAPTPQRGSEMPPAEAPLGSIEPKSAGGIDVASAATTPAPLVGHQTEDDAAAAADEATGEASATGTIKRRRLHHPRHV